MISISSSRRTAAGELSWESTSSNTEGPEGNAASGARSQGRWSSAAALPQALLALPVQKIAVSENSPITRRRGAPSTERANSRQLLRVIPTCPPRSKIASGIATISNQGTTGRTRLSQAQSPNASGSVVSVPQKAYPPASHTEAERTRAAKTTKTQETRALTHGLDQSTPHVSARRRPSASVPAPLRQGVRRAARRHSGGGVCPPFRPVRRRMNAQKPLVS
jgi:hypothetical protein